MSRLLDLLRALRARIHFNHRYSGHRGALAVTPTGVQLLRYGVHGSAILLEPAWSFAWSDVRSVCGFKRDPYVVDLICLVFEFSDGTAVEVNEEMEGYNALTEALPARFPDLDASWWGKVAHPPFATSLTTIWEATNAPETTHSGGRNAPSD